FRSGRSAIFLVTVFSLIWLAGFVLADDLTGIFLMSYFVIFNILSLLLLRLHLEFAGRVFWMFAAFVGVVMAILASQKGYGTEMLFLPLAGLAFLIFSWRYERKTLLFFAFLTVPAWMSVLHWDLVGSSERLFGLDLFDPNFEAARLYGVRLTTIFILLIELVYFSHLTRVIEDKGFDAAHRAKSSERAKSEFLANMSHEIRTPFNGVIGMIEILEHQDPTDEQKRTIGIIRNSAFSLLRIIDDILDASRIEAGKLSIAKSKTDLYAVIEGVTSTLLPIADEKDVRLRLYVDPALPEWIVADSGRLRQVLLNLLGNSIKYSATSQTGRKADVVFHVSRTDDGKISFGFDDNGPGIPAALLEHLFTPFTRGETVAKGNVDGAGLGLSISKNLVDLMGGEIFVESTPDEGSKFTVRLPLEPTDGPRRLEDISRLSVIWVGQSEDFVIRRVKHIFEYHGSTINFLPRCDELETLCLDPDLDHFFILALRDGPSRETCLSKLQKQMPKAKFLDFTQDRSEKLGLVNENVYLAQIAPLLPTDYHRGLATLAGRASLETDATRNRATGTPIRANGKTVLIVEDNEINQIVLDRQLQSLGFQTRLAENGDAALQIWKSEKPELIISDLNMPVMNGYDLVQSIRASERHGNLPHLPIIALSANATEEEHRKALKLGFDNYLVKPVEVKNLRKALAAFGHDLG
ncbi:MAG: response regulator, partial [Paracoccaceae bacterium]|nr:response regulator [Paracoccaceae bacterium]